MFIFLVNVFNGMPGGRVIGLVFFLCVLFAGLTSLVNLYEVSVEALQDKLHFKRVAAVAVIAVIGTAVSLCIQAIVSDWMDVVSIYICPLGALLAGILFFWVAGKDFVLAAVNKGAGKPHRRVVLSSEQIRLLRLRAARAHRGRAPRRHRLRRKRRPTDGAFRRNAVRYT